MTTKSLDDILFKLKIVLSWRFPRKTAFRDDFPLCPHCPPSRNANFIFIIVSPSLTFTHVLPFAVGQSWHQIAKRHKMLQGI